MKYVVVDEANFKDALELLNKADLPVSDLVLSDRLKLYALNDQQGIIAICGIELFNKEALLRSFVVDENMRSTGMGKKIYNYALDQAHLNGVQKLVLLTTTAKQWFLNKGWSIIDRNSVSEAIASSKEFSSICPGSATCMTLNLLK